jgi:glucan phosphoethanolaminetransferase (alkaline phosphatase superfamily)
MWLPGHLAVGFLICLPAIIVYSRKERSLVLALVYVAFFANLLDFLHIGDLRPFSHSFFGAALMLGAALLLLITFQGWKPLLAAIAFLAVGSHLLADVFIGHIYPWYPWSMEIVQFNQFNTMFDIRVELVLSSLAFVLLAALMAVRPNRLAVDGYRRKDLRALMALLTVFFVFASAQALYYIYLDIFHGPSVSEFLLSYVFIGVIASSMAFLVLSINAYKNDIESPKRNRFFTHIHYRGR